MTRELAQRVTERLEAALSARCTVGSARLLSARRAALSDVACVMEEGPILGFAAVHTTVELEAAPLPRRTVRLRSVVVDGVHVRARPPEPDDDSSADSGDDDSSAHGSLSGTLQSALRRVSSVGAWLATGPGAGSVRALGTRLVPGASIRVEHVTVDLPALPAGLPLPTDLAARLEWVDEGGTIAVVARLPGDGRVATSAALDSRGLGDVTVALERLDLVPLLRGTDALDLRQARLSGRVLSSRAEGSWSFDLSMEDTFVAHDFLGPEPTTLPSLRLAGSTRLSEEGLDLPDGRWTIAGVTGDLSLRLASLSAAPTVQARVGGEGLALGALLGALPDALLPGSWADEIQGTIDLRLTVGGPLHDRAAWTLDWQTDFSKVVLADGELAAQVQGLKGAFVHRFPTHAGQENAPPRERLIGPGDGHFTPLSEISSWLRAAVVSTEDAGFFGHSGFEVTEIKEAVLENLREGEGRGGSTITQQLAKNLFLSGERTVARKLREAVIAWRLEEELGKGRILEIYLNIAEWGPGLYGIRDAADHYFARTPSVLTPEESAFIASLLPAPIRFHGYYHGDRGLTDKRQERVQQILATMHRLGSLDEVEYARAAGEVVQLAPCPF